MGKHKKNLSEGEIVLYPEDRDVTKRWYVEYFNPAKNRICRKWLEARFGTGDERLGEFARIKTQLLAQGTIDKKDAVEKYNPSLTASKRLNNVLSEKTYLKPKSKSGYKSKLKKFDEFCLKFGHTEVTEKVAHDYLKYRLDIGKAATTINNDRRVLKTLLKALPHSSSTIRKNAFDKTKKLRGSGAAGREYYKPTQKNLVKEFLLKHDPALWLACKFVYYCYVRNGNELINLRVSDLDLHLNRLRIGAENSKNGECEFVVIPKAFVQELIKIDYSKYPGDAFLISKNGLPCQKPVSLGYWGKQHRKALDAMRFDKGGKRYSMYSWKNTGVVDSYLAGIGIKDLQGQLRHQNLETTYLYLKSMGLFDNADTFDKINPL